MYELQIQTNMLLFFRGLLLNFLAYYFHRYLFLHVCKFIAIVDHVFSRSRIRENRVQAWTNITTSYNADAVERNVFNPSELYMIITRNSAKNCWWFQNRSVLSVVLKYMQVFSFFVQNENLTPLTRRILRYLKITQNPSMSLLETCAKNIELHPVDTNYPSFLLAQHEINISAISQTSRLSQLETFCHLLKAHLNSWNNYSLKNVNSHATSN